MRILLDTAAFWWLAIDAAQLSSRARLLFADVNNDIFLSPVSIWELLVKNALGKLPTPTPLSILLPNVRNIREVATLPFTESAAFRVAALPLHHRDPFDRMLICQAIDQNLTLLTPDRQLSAYPVAIAW